MQRLHNDYLDERNGMEKNWPYQAHLYGLK